MTFSAKDGGVFYRSVRLSEGEAEALLTTLNREARRESYARKLADELNAAMAEAYHIQQEIAA